MSGTMRDLFQGLFSPKAVLRIQSEWIEYYDFVMRIRVVDADGLRRAALRNPRGLRPDPRGLWTDAERWIDTVCSPTSVPGCSIRGSRVFYRDADVYDYELRLRLADARAVRAAAIAHPNSSSRAVDRDGGGVIIEACLLILLSRSGLPGCAIDCQDAYFDVRMRCG
jgi:hypothetical protein